MINKPTLMCCIKQSRQQKQYQSVTATIIYNYKNKKYLKKNINARNIKLTLKTDGQTD